MQADKMIDPNLQAEALADYGILDTPREARFDSITRNLADQTKTPIAFIAFLDKQRLWMKSSVGVPFLEIPIEASITAKLLNEGKTEVVVPELEKLEGFKPGVFATDRLGTKSLILKALITPSGVVVGAVCVMDVTNRNYGEPELKAITAASNAVVELLEIRRVVDVNHPEALSTHTSTIDAGDFEENIHQVVNSYMQDTLENFDWWAAQAWWYQEDALYPGEWQIAPHTPLSLKPISKSIFGAEKVVKIKKAYLEPQLVDLSELNWMTNQDRLSQLGARYAVVMDIFGSADPAVRLVFIVPSPRFFDDSTKKFFAVSTALLPKVITRERVRGELQYRSMHDALTGLLNRRGLNQLIEEAARESTSNRAVMFLDLDNFKSINDKYGHAVGDELLIHVAHTLSSNTRPTDTVARIGGDEFVIVTSETDVNNGIKVLADRVYQSLAKPFTLSNGVSWNDAASIGVATWPAGSSFDQALEIADSMMYNAKKSTSGIVYETIRTNSDGSVGTDAANIIKFMKIAEDESAAAWGYLMTIESKMKNPDIDKLVSDITAVHKAAGIKGDRYVLWLPKALWFDEDSLDRLIDKLSYQLQQAQIAVILNGNGASADAKSIAINLRTSNRARTVLSGFGSGNKEFELLQSLQPMALAIDPDLANRAAESKDFELSIRAVVAICESLGITALAPFGCSPKVLQKLADLGCRLRVIS
jgi:diguanylate cyclase (GGDEF)-like protein